MPIFIAFAAFVLVLYAQRHGFPVATWLGENNPFKGPGKAAGQKSGVRTEFLEMILDHDSGAMDGTCLKGRFAGRKLSTLKGDDYLQLHDELQKLDAQAATLLEAYLDQRWPDWRSKRSNPKAKDRARPGSSSLNLDEAYDVLGLKRGATKDEIRAAHRRLMLKLHPDHGGSTYFAARLNEARDALLG